MACELVSDTEVALTFKRVTDLRFPLGEMPEWMVLVELGDIGPGDRLQEDLQLCLEGLFEDGTVTDGAICQNLRESEELWRWRHSFSEANKKAGHGIVFGASLRVKAVPEFIERAIPAALELAPWAVRLIVTHLGDGNVHLIVMNKREDIGKIADLEDLTHRMFDKVYDVIEDLDGSFSAENGVGRKLVEEMQRRQPAAEIQLMHANKRAFDPKELLSPGVLVEERNADK